MFEHTVLSRLCSRSHMLEVPPPPIGGGFSISSIKQTIKQSEAFWLQRQWWAGQSEKGLIGEYAPSTIRHKQRRKLPYDRVTLFETGTLYAKTSITLKDNMFIVKVDVPYAKHLEQRYGDRIWWLGGIYKQDFINAYIAKIRKYVLSRLWQSAK